MFFLQVLEKNVFSPLPFPTNVSPVPLRRGAKDRPIRGVSAICHEMPPVMDMKSVDLVIGWDGIVIGFYR